MRLRYASKHDKRRLYDWRYQDEHTAGWYHGRRVEWNPHSRWVDLMIQSPSVDLWVAEVDGISVGQCRIDSNGEVSYSVDLNFRGRGYGAQILEAAQRLTGHARLKASVDRSNTHGSDTLVKAGFDHHPDVDFYLWRRNQS